MTVSLAYGVQLAISSHSQELQYGHPFFYQKEAHRVNMKQIKQNN